MADTQLKYITLYLAMLGTVSTVGDRTQVLISASVGALTYIFFLWASKLVQQSSCLC